MKSSILRMSRLIGATLLALAASLAIPVASAADFGASLTIGNSGTGYTGKGAGYTETATTGGSAAETKSYGVGTSTAYSKNNGDSYAHGGAGITPSGANSYTSGGSTSNAQTKTYVSGLAQGESSGGVGNDYSSKAYSQYETYQHDNSHTGYGAYKAYTK